MIKLLKTFLAVCGVLLMLALGACGLGMMGQGFVTNSWKLVAGGFLVVAVALAEIIMAFMRWLELP
jgi:hypothetical protein